MNINEILLAIVGALVAIVIIAGIFAPEDPRDETSICCMVQVRSLQEIGIES